MKKIFTVLLCVFILLFSACADKGTLGKINYESFSENGGEIADAPKIGEKELSLMPIKEIRENWENEVNSVRSKNYSNINFKNTHFFFTEADEVYELTYRRKVNEFTAQEVFETMCGYIEQFRPDVYSDEEKKSQIRFLGRGRVNDGDYPEYFPNYEQVLKMGDDVSALGAVFLSGELLLAVNGGGLCSFVDSEIPEKCGYPSAKLDLFDFVNYKWPVVFRTENVFCDKVFHLEDGDISVFDAAKKTEEFLNKTNYYPRESGVSLAVSSVNVVDMGEGNFAFCFGAVPKYKGLRFSAILVDESFNSYESLSNSTNEPEIMGQAVMVNSERPEKMCLSGNFFDRAVSETGAFSSIISLEQAADIAAGYLSPEMRFDALSAAAVYKDFSAKDAGTYTRQEDYREREITAEPCYKFSLKNLNGDTTRVYHVYVNMLTGKAYTLIQRMYSEEQYE